MHHGYYPTPDYRDDRAAQIKMIEETLKWGYGLDRNADLPERFFHNKRMVDVGCGVGGSSRYIIRRFGGTAVGISLSPFQVQKAQKYSAVANLTSHLEYRVADAMAMPFPDNSFDLGNNCRL